MARLYTGQGVPLEDLIGEGNLALAMGVSMLGALEHAGEAQGMLGRMMMDAMEDLIQEQQTAEKADRKMTERINRVLEAARSAGFNIPSLCFLKDINEIGACRMCVVEVKGARSLMASCVYPVAEGMEVFTNTPKVRHSRQLTLELILSNHRMDCLTCARNAHCELRQLASDLGIDAVRYANDQLPPQLETA